MADLTVTAVDGEGSHTVTVAIGKPLPADTPLVIQHALSASGHYVNGVVVLPDSEQAPVPVEQPADVPTADATAQE